MAAQAPACTGQASCTATAIRYDRATPAGHWRPEATIERRHTLLKNGEDQKDPLHELVGLADAATLGRLVCLLAAARPDVRRECFEFLREHAPLSSQAHATATAEAVLALWDELEPDLAELDEYGGADLDLADDVADLLRELARKLRKPDVPRDDRRALLDEILPFIQSGNAGLEDSLSEVARAACHDNEDLRDLAERLEETGKDWLLDNARRIYREIGDRGKYLALRARRMEVGADYHDLATFHWEQGEREEALAVARKGLKEATGRMNELREFLAERAKESGDRQGYLALQLAQAAAPLTAKSYKAFRELCTDEEWIAHEPRILAAAEGARPEERLQIHMLRGELERAAALLTETAYPGRYASTVPLTVAASLEKKFPEQILAYYLSGLGDLDCTDTRRTYAEKAKVARKARHMWLDILDQPAKWQAFAKKTKSANRARPAFQQEFAKALPDWHKL